MVTDYRELKVIGDKHTARPQLPQVAEAGVSDRDGRARRLLILQKTLDAAQRIRDEPAVNSWLRSRGPR